MNAQALSLNLWVSSLGRQALGRTKLTPKQRAAIFFRKTLNTEVLGVKELLKSIFVIRLIVVLEVCILRSAPPFWVIII